ncbi:hypothetical protein, partial [Veronia pacifica]
MAESINNISMGNSQSIRLIDEQKSHEKASVEQDNLWSTLFQQAESAMQARVTSSLTPAFSGECEQPNVDKVYVETKKNLIDTVKTSVADQSVAKQILVE